MQSMTNENRITLLETALKPFADIADEYDQDGLDEARPSWIRNGKATFDSSAELYSGRGGKTLITLGDVLRARSALQGKSYDIPKVDPHVARARELYEASCPNIGWLEMSEDRRNQIIANYRKLEK